LIEFGAVALSEQWAISAAAQVRETDRYCGELGSERRRGLVAKSPDLGCERCPLIDLHRSRVDRICEERVQA